MPKPDKPKRALPFRTDRLPPHSPEAEVSLVGCALSDPARFFEVSAELPEGEDSFYDVRCRKVWAAAASLAGSGRTPDVVSVVTHLRDIGGLESAGGVEYVAGLPDAVTSAANLKEWARTVREKRTLRGALRVFGEFGAAAYTTDGDFEDYIGGLEREVLALRPSRLGLSHRSARELVSESVALIERMHERRGQITGLPTGLVDLDKLIDGLHPAELVIVSGFPSTGKTSLAMNWVEHAAADLGRPVGVVSLEMTAAQLMLRMHCSRARVNLRSVRDGAIGERDFARLATASAQLAKSPIHVVSECSASAETVRAAARRLRQQHGIKLLVVDYLQLMSARTRRKDANRAEELGEASAQMKATAMELGIPVVVLSQVSDDGKLYGSREPGHDADGVLKIVNEGEWDPRTQQVSLRVEKNRNGPTGEVKLVFIKEFTRFECAAKVSDEDVPRGAGGYE